MAISIQKVLDRFHFPPHSLRTDLFGLGEGCHPLRTGPLSVRTQLQALVLQPERGSFCRHTAAMLADFSQQAYRDRPIDSEFPLGSLRRPLVTPTTCGTFVRTHPDILSVDDVQLLVCRNDYGEIVFAFRGLTDNRTRLEFKGCSPDWLAAGDDASSILYRMELFHRLGELEAR